MASSFRTRYVVAIALGAALLVPAFASSAASAKPKQDTFVVCKHGCRYRSIQAAVDKSGRKDTIRVKPGHYVGGVEIDGSRHDGLRIIGTGGKPSAVVLDGKNAPIAKAQNGIYGEGVDNLVVKNLTAKRFLGNGVFVHACHGYLMKDLVAAFNRSYGLFAKSCTGGRMTQSVGYGQGDSAYYIGETPPAEQEAAVDLARPPQGLRERPRLLRAPTRATSTSTTPTSTTTGSGWCRTRSTRRSTSRPSTGSSRTTTSSGTTSTTTCRRRTVKTVSSGLGEVGRPDPQLPDRDRRDAVRRQRLEGARTTTSSATSSTGWRPSPTRSTRAMTRSAGTTR